MSVRTLNTYGALTIMSRFLMLLLHMTIFITTAAGTVQARSKAIFNNRVEQPGPTTITTKQGILQGEATPYYRRFLNIPFAAPPLGHLRFAPPAAPRSWNGVRNATAIGMRCIQNGRGIDSAHSEDCLQLNVYTPLFQEGSSVDNATAESIKSFEKKATATTANKLFSASSSFTSLNPNPNPNPPPPPPVTPPPPPHPPQQQLLQQQQRHHQAIQCYFGFMVAAMRVEVQ